MYRRFLAQSTSLREPSSPVQVEALNCSFDEGVKEFWLSYYQDFHAVLTFIDPFGYKELDQKFISQILRFPKVAKSFFKYYLSANIVSGRSYCEFDDWIYGFGFEQGGTKGHIHRNSWRKLARNIFQPFTRE